jgi:ribonuclease P protein subunit RPR2
MWLLFIYNPREIVLEQTTGTKTEIMAPKQRNPNRKKIARERIAILFEHAERFFPEHPEWSDRCVERARKIAMRERVRIPREYRRRFCRRCNAYLVPGINMRVRVHGGKVIVTCRVCGNQRRYQLGGAP